MSDENIIDQETALCFFKPSSHPTENHLLLLAVPLIGLMVSLKNGTPEKNKEDLSATILQIFHHFNLKAQHIGYPTRIILAAQYCMCSALDESIMNTAWGREVKWGNQSLLTILYKETFGGERFYIILENMLSNPEENINLLELIYVLLSLGFKGKYYNKDSLYLEAVRIDLFKKISPFLHGEPKDFLLQCIPQFKRGKQKIILPLWLICAFTMLALLLIMTTYDYALNRASLPIFNFLETLYSSFNQQENLYEKNS